jgi:tRNA (guanine-N7-)-methyltransferase
MFPPDPVASTAVSNPNPEPVRSTEPAVIERDKRIYQPASWFERLNLAQMFGRTVPVEVELGSGDGSFLLEWARLHPDRDFIGVERLLGRIRKIDRKSQKLGLTNILGLRIEAAYCVEYLLPSASASAIHIYFPDPWPKRRHHKNRLVNERFTTLVREALKPGAAVHLRTDSTDYFEQMRTVFDACAGLRAVPTPADLAAVMTDFERGFVAAGIPTQRASYVKD